MNIDDLLARCSFPALGTAVTCAFSGGADSTALIVLAKAAGCNVTAVHIDHGLRPASAAEAEQAAVLAGSVGVPFRSMRVDVAAGPNLEARARDARYSALPGGALTGHTADDQAETLLINLMRGAGFGGLAGIKAGPTHPLLALRRAETKAVCNAAGLSPLHDPTNDDRRFVRNRVRHEVLPLLDDIAQRDVTAVLARTARLLGDEAGLLDTLALTIDATDAKAVAAAGPALARRALRAWLTQGGYPPDLATVNRVLAVAQGDHVACDIGDGRRVERHRQRLRIVETASRSAGRTDNLPVASTDGMGNSDHPRAAP